VLSTDRRLARLLTNEQNEVHPAFARLRQTRLASTACRSRDVKTRSRNVLWLCTDLTAKVTSKLLGRREGLSQERCITANVGSRCKRRRL